MCEEEEGISHLDVKASGEGDEKKESKVESNSDDHTNIIIAGAAVSVLLAAATFVYFKLKGK